MGNNVSIGNLTGLAGGQSAGANATVTGNFNAIQCVNDTIFTAITSNVDTTALLNQTVPAGVILYGVVTAFTTGGSGLVVAYTKG